MQRRDSVWRTKCIALQERLDELIGRACAEKDRSAPDPDPPAHSLCHLAERTSMAMREHVRLDRQDLSSEQGWQCIHTEGSMRVFRREMELNGRIVDPLKMEMVVRGVSGYEMCWYFWSPDFRLDWDSTLESVKVIDRIGPNNVICYQTHRRVWPSAQRDACILSQLATFDDDHDEEHSRPIHDDDDDDAAVHNSPTLTKKPTWIVVNQSVEHDLAPPDKNPNLVRVTADVAMTCETFVANQAQSRTDVTTRITYVASINPGGWAPSAAVRALAKREFPKFLSKFTAYVKDKTKNAPLIFNAE